ncbi:unnamed protein product [Lampetra fluviatilis]
MATEGASTPGGVRPASSSEEQQQQEQQQQEQQQQQQQAPAKGNTSESTPAAAAKAQAQARAGKKAKGAASAMACKVALLDGAQYECEVEKHSKGQVLFDKVCDHLNLLEKDYFGLAFQDAHDHKNWLDPAKDIKKQVGNGPWAFSFNVKFYPPDPSQLTEDITRYYVCLQLRQDVSSGRLPCSFVTLALLGSYALQAELGDHEADEHGADYVASSGFRFAPAHSHELLEKIAELHKTHRGQTPAEAERHFLENAKKLSMYGVDLHQAKDSEGVDITLGVCSSGLLVYKDRLRINRFPWPKILKISYKRSNFYIKIRPGELDQFESTIGFKLPNHRAAKRLWKVCVEHHTFFRLVTPEPAPKGRFLTLGSRFRYSGRTQAQTRAASSQIDRPAPHFTRSASKRYTVSSSLDGGDASGRAGGWAGGWAGRWAGRQANERAEGRYPLFHRRSGHFGPSQAPCRTPPPALLPSFLPYLFQTNPPHRRPKKADGENIYIRHSRLMLEELERRPDELLLKRQASLSELKRSFLESRPDGAAGAMTAPPAGGWDIRLQEPSPVRRHGQPGAEPPLIATESVSFSEVSHTGRADFSTTDVPIVHTHTKTITYAATQEGRGGEASESSVLPEMAGFSAESVATTTTTHITKTVKGGISETRIEKRIVIMADTDIDHDQALAQAIREAKEQHPDMAVTKVVVHKETDVSIEDDDDDEEEQRP